MKIKPKEYYCEGCGKYLGNENDLYKIEHDEIQCLVERWMEKKNKENEQDEECY